MIVTRKSREYNFFHCHEITWTANRDLRYNPEKRRVSASPSIDGRFSDGITRHLFTRDRGFGHRDHPHQETPRTTPFLVHQATISTCRFSAKCQLLHLAGLDHLSVPILPPSTAKLSSAQGLFATLPRSI